MSNSHGKLRFDLLGDDPEGIAMCLALQATGRYELVNYGGPRSGSEVLAKAAIPFQLARDLEELLADPHSDLVIVADRSGRRGEQLRRALQAEKHVLCAYPPDHTPDAAYEASMIQADTGRLLLPLLPKVLHPAILGMAGQPELVELRQSSIGPVVVESPIPGQQPAIPGWEVLRAIGGEIAEVSAFAAESNIARDKPLMLSGRFERGGVFQMQLLPGQPANSVSILARGQTGQASLTFPDGWLGQAHLRQEPGAKSEEKIWPSWDPWPAMIEVVEEAMAGQPKNPLVTWQSAIRGLELDDAVRRSLANRRVSVLEYPEATEEVGFKGTMTLAGCAILFLVLLLLVFSRWLPWLGWAILPALLLFLGLQFLRWLIPGKGRQSPTTTSEPERKL
jgi:hypothetical protein